jgi:UDP-N-acetyl-D-galactosamine dehydrogenase
VGNLWNKEVLEMKICVVGLGYVGLPLLLELLKTHDAVGFDTNSARVDELKAGFDRTNEVKEQCLSELELPISCHESILAGCDIFIVTVPTPIDTHKVPDLSPLKSASKLIGRYLKAGAVVAYESTVFPGTTEDICVPILEEESGLKLNKDFSVGYSPERINPGDKDRGVRDIVKIVSASSEDALEQLSILYNSVVDAGLYKAESIKVAEAAKVCENIQRDVNIALMNELSMIFQGIGIDTNKVIDAASSKWNFLPFRPGFVGGHCIGVDPYYLVYKSMSTSKTAELISKARDVNEEYVTFSVTRVIEEIVRVGFDISDLKVCVIGCTFKPNCPDLRNSKVESLVSALAKLNIKPIVWDPVADSHAALVYGDSFTAEKPQNRFDVILFCVNHQVIESEDVISLRKCDRSFIFDFKAALPMNSFVHRP